MDAVEIEHMLAGPLGVRIGLRGEVNDADSIRAGDPKLLAKALTKIIPKLKKRIEQFPESESHLKVWMEDTLSNMDAIQKSLKERPKEVGHLSVFLLWAACGHSLHWVHLTLKEHGL